MRKGFTLIELLIVIAILSILSVIGINNFQTARIKAQDIKRKSDLSTVAKSLEAFVNDHHAYPLSDSNGKIICQGSSTVCDWGTSFTDGTTLYTATLPAEELSSLKYIYVSTGTSYTLYARLANAQDPAIDATITTSCGTLVCNYKITSSNIQ